MIPNRQHRDAIRRALHLLDIAFALVATPLLAHAQDGSTLLVTSPAVIDSVQVKRNAAGVAKLILKGRGFIADSVVGADGTGFARSARVKDRKLTQSGALSGGMTIDEAIPSGREVRITVSSPTVAGSYVSVLYTRP